MLVPGADDDVDEIIAYFGDQQHVGVLLPKLTGNDDESSNKFTVDAWLADVRVVIFYWLGESRDAFPRVARIWWSNRVAW